MVVSMFSILLGFVLLAFIVWASMILFQRSLERVEDRSYLRKKAREEMDRQIHESHTPPTVPNENESTQS